MQILCKSNAKLRGDLHCIISLLIVHKVFAQFALCNLLMCCFKTVMLMMHVRFSHNVPSVTSLLLVSEECFLLTSISFSRNINILTYCSENVILAYARKAVHKFPSRNVLTYCVINVFFAYVRKVFAQCPFGKVYLGFRKCVFCLCT